MSAQSPKKPSELTEPSHWDQYWGRLQLPSVVDESCNHVVRSMHRVFRQVLPYNKEFKFLELGCAPGRWMVYFSREFGYQVAGCDTSPYGLQITAKNLELCGIRPLGLWNGRADQTGARAESFDVVASFGLIEHFTDPAPVLREHVRLLKKGGYLILEMPNVRGVNRLVQRVINPGFLQWHNISIMTRDFLRRLAREWSLEIVFLDFVGGWAPSDYYFERPSIIKPFLNRVIWVFSQVRHRVRLIDNVNSPLFSGYLMAIYNKPRCY